MILWYYDMILWYNEDIISLSYCIIIPDQDIIMFCCGYITIHFLKDTKHGFSTVILLH